MSHQRTLKLRTPLVSIACVDAMLIGITRAASGQARGKDVEWPTYGGWFSNSHR
jgi:hypothetical protein